MFSDFILIAALILANGFFAAAEMALVSTRQVRLQNLAEDGDIRADKALRVRENPGEFLATVQIGITLVGTLASAVGGVEASRWLAPQIARLPLLAPYAGQIALGLVVVTIAYASLIFGELVPKRLAIRDPEGFAMSVVRIFEVMARVMQLPLRVLTVSADGVLKLFKTTDAAHKNTSPEEIEIMVRRGAAEGVILPIQEQMIERVFDYADRSTRDEMTPRMEIIALEVDTPIEQALEMAKEHGFSRYPVIDDAIDHILGYVHIKDLIWAKPGQHLSQMLRTVVFIPEAATLPQAFTTLTRSGHQLGIVLDEFGGTEGLITLENILEVIVGEIEDEHSPIAEAPQQIDDGTWYIAGSEPLFDVEVLLDIHFEANLAYNTLAGFIMNQLGEIPAEGAQLTHAGYCFTVTEMDRLRIVSVRVQPAQSTSPTTAS